MLFRRGNRSRSRGGISCVLLTLLLEQGLYVRAPGVLMFLVKGRRVVGGRRASSRAKTDPQRKFSLIDQRGRRLLEAHQFTRFLNEDTMTIEALTGGMDLLAML